MPRKGLLPNIRTGHHACALSAVILALILALQPSCKYGLACGRTSAPGATWAFPSTVARHCMPDTPIVARLATLVAFACCLVVRNNYGLPSVQTYILNYSIKNDYYLHMTYVRTSG